MGHWGGRLIGQLENHADLLVCWRATTEEPRRVEESMLAAFEIHYGRLPFANLSHYPWCRLRLIDGDSREQASVRSGGSAAADARRLTVRMGVHE